VYLLTCLLEFSALVSLLVRLLYRVRTVSSDAWTSKRQTE